MIERVLSELLCLSRLVGKLLSEVAVLSERVDTLEESAANVARLADRASDKRTTWSAQIVAAIVASLVGGVVGHFIH